MQAGAELYLRSAVLSMVFRNAVWVFERRLL